MQDYGKQYEINYSRQQIKKLTPYLDKIEVPKNNKKSKKPNYINPKQRAFAWYYVFNGNNKSDGYRRAYRGVYNHKLKIIEIPEIDDDNKTPIKQMDAINGQQQYSKTYIKEAIKLIRAETKEEFMQDCPQTLVEQLEIMATYDPAMFYDKSGNPVFDKMEDIPKKYRCCIEGIETKYYGKDADRKVIILKLTDRNKVQDRLLKILPDLINPEKFEHLHKTIDKEGNEVGFDQKKLNDKDLKRRMSELEERIKGE
jgi:hypothetical protein